MTISKLASDWKPPGSEEALAAGCTCAVMDNCRGKGRGMDGVRFGWVTTADCPLHGFEPEDYDAPPQEEP